MTDFAKVFELASFELPPGQQMPNDKSQLTEKFWEGKLARFHELVGPRCHLVPHWRDWINAKPEQGQVSVVILLGCGGGGE